MEDGEQEAVTELIVGELLLLPQAAISTRLPTMSRIPKLRTALSPQWISLAWTPCGNNCGM
jgi:hypothetical protein